MTATEDVKASLKKTLELSLATAKALYDRVAKELRSVEVSEMEWIATFKRLKAASAQYPVRPWHRYYQRELAPASEPLFVGLEDAPNDEHFGEIEQAFLDHLIATFQDPAVAATTDVFEDVTEFFRETASRVLTLRYFSNSDAILILLCHKRRGKNLGRWFKQVGQRTSRATIWGMIARRREAIDAGMWRSTRTGSSAWLEISG
jgi:hypothetical protein